MKVNIFHRKMAIKLPYARNVCEKFYTYKNGQFYQGTSACNKHVSSVCEYNRGGQTCSIEDSFTENQKHQRAVKSVCRVNPNMVNNARFT